MNTNNNSIKKEDFTNNLLNFFKETFEGTTSDGNIFIDKGTGLFDTIENISADVASKSLGDNNATIVAHLEHTRFYLVALQEFMNGRTEKVDWNDSWLINNVSESDWNLLKQNTRKEYDKLTEIFNSIENWDDDKISDALGIVIHTAYHLGAIRQIAKAIG